MRRLFGSSNKGAVGPEVEAEFDLCFTAIEERRFSDAQKGAQQVVARAPQSAQGWYLLGAASVELDAYEDARAAFARGLALAPDDVDLAVAQAELLVHAFGEEVSGPEEAIKLCQKGRKRAQKLGDDTLIADFLLLEARAWTLLGETTRALSLLDLLLSKEPEHLEGKLERALTLFESCAFEEAEAALQSLLKVAPDDPEVVHTLALLKERSGEEEEARRLFETARELAPEDFPAPVELGEEAFDSVVEDALRRLPEDVRHHLENVTVAVEPLPPEEDLVASDPPLSPTILGMFRGTPVGQRSVTRAEDHFPAAIVLYQRNLERFARSREELVEQIGITVMHEFGHLLGLDEDDLRERGLD